MPQMTLDWESDPGQPRCRLRPLDVVRAIYQLSQRRR